MTSELPIIKVEEMSIITSIKQQNRAPFGNRNNLYEEETSLWKINYEHRCRQFKPEQHISKLQKAET